ncbi:MAG TPA: YdeI/OmpD-associated family protein [Chitinophaga sp.]|uniref:YdeI/OmpD-associated family protein n=1 Tax=Chitinophaga sp. TaxID=1869181 RepID=UPI002BDBF883|nr:YdeI/OmpD-associated family protein [Chitinophaga sp.]HVI47877.1 YdeI/OmpD-associated family protein [Chitinophaga sp.]
MEQLPLIDKDLQLEKFQGKGGWTFVRLADIPKDKSSYFGGRKVRGFIDSYELKQYTLMPMGKGVLFLPVKAEIRKKIGKQEGDYVRVILYDDTSGKLEIVPEDFTECLKDEPAAWNAFNQLSSTEQQECVRWLLEVSVNEVRIQRMADAVNHLAAGRNYNGTRK